MSLILVGTILSGVIFSKLLLMVGLENMLVRFPVVLILAYLCFFIFMRLWLNYLTRPFRENKNEGSLLDAADALSHIPDIPLSGSTPNFQGHGGDFGGAGAAGTWTDIGDSGKLPLSHTMGEASNTVGGSVGESAGSAISGVADEGGILLIPLALLLAVIFGGGIYLIYEAPVILSEAAFELILASTVIKKARKMDDPDWIGSVFRATWPALALTMLVTLITGWALSNYCPQAIKIREVFQICL